MSGAIVRRIIARATLRFERPVLFGGGDAAEGAADVVVLRDAAGRPYAPGSSLAGAMKAWLRRRMYGPGAQAGAVVALFAPVEGDETLASPLIVDDAYFVDPVVTVRDHVRLDPARGAAADHAKFDVEHVPAGATLPLRLELVVRDNHKGVAGAGGLLAQLKALLDALERGEIAFGARTRRGFGRGAVDRWVVQNLSMARLDHVVAWLGRDETRAVGDAKITGDTIPDRRDFFEAQCHLALVDTILSRDRRRPTTSDETEVTAHVRAIDVEGRPQPVVAGSGVVGALRQRVRQIAALLGAEAEARAIFGSTERAGRVEVRESYLKGTTAGRRTRLAIDRFTGGPVAGRLFTVEPEVAKQDGGANLDLELRLDSPTDREVALLVAALKDLFAAALPIAGEGGAGRGSFRLVRAEFTRRTGQGQTTTWSAAPVDGAFRVSCTTRPKVDFPRLEPKEEA